MFLNKHKKWRDKEIEFQTQIAKSDEYQKILTSQIEHLKYLNSQKLRAQNWYEQKSQESYHEERYQEFRIIIESLKHQNIQLDKFMSRKFIESREAVKKEFEINRNLQNLQNANEALTKQLNLQSQEYNVNKKKLEKELEETSKKLTAQTFKLWEDQKSHERKIRELTNDIKIRNEVLEQAGKQNCAYIINLQKEINALSKQLKPYEYIRERSQSEVKLKYYFQCLRLTYIKSQMIPKQN